MKRFEASGAIGLLLTLLVISIVFISVMPTLKGDNNNGGLFGNSSGLDAKSVETRVNEQVKEIENLRKNNLKDMDNINQEY